MMQGGEEERCGRFTRRREGEGRGMGCVKRRGARRDGKAGCASVRGRKGGIGGLNRKGG